MEQKWVVFLTIGILFLSMGVGQADPSGVSDPAKVNRIIQEMETPQVEPGSSDAIILTLTNPYNSTMNHVNFTIDIYKYAELGEEKNISEVESPPVFRESGRTIRTVDLASIESGDREELRYRIRSKEKTEEGVYLLRLRLRFVYEEEERVMKSKGYFSSEEWEEATSSENITETDEEHYQGGVNLTSLNVTGILQESSFSVKEPLPRWPQYLLGIFVAVFGTLAVMSYMQEKYGSFPWLEKAFDKWSSKLEKFRRRLEKRFD
ncbi:MAG: hypothetical protein KGY76_03745 [Candidatus Thermoplasmatota archaeon]|nr:hypothetical protein [Candidatus Thermoplasmatota archaeon]